MRWFLSCLALGRPKFQIPMRGNEVHGRGDGLLGVCQFQIPMRGNESVLPGMSGLPVMPGFKSP